MKKKLNVDSIANELKGASAFFGKPEENQTKQPTEQPTNQSTVQSINKSTDQSVDQPTGQSSNQLRGETTDSSTNKAITQPTDSTANRSTEHKSKRSTPQPGEQPIKPAITRTIDTSSILGKPKAFYISEKQDDDLNTAVTNVTAKLKGKVAHKIDRSTIVRLILEESNLSSTKTAERLANRLINRLISQLTG